MPARPLTAFEREEIRSGIDLERSDCEIARVLGRSRSTIGREIGRSGGRAGYSAVRAQVRADEKRCRSKTPVLVKDPALAAHVTERLELLDSPMTISIELARGTHGVFGSISHETIYQAVYRSGWGLHEGIHRCLHLGRRKRKHQGRKSPGSHSLGIYCRIHDRPDIAAQRVEVGHLEGDQIVGAYNRSAILTVFDRASRYLWLARLDGKGKDSTRDALIELLNRIPPELRRTLTWDQGSEMAHHPQIALTSGIEIYIADPKSPWQRPTNENGNALVRRYVGKGTDLNIYTTKDLQAIETRINTTPRRSLNWATAHDIYTQAVAMTD